MRRGSAVRRKCGRGSLRAAHSSLAAIRLGNDVLPLNGRTIARWGGVLLFDDIDDLACLRIDHIGATADDRTLIWNVRCVDRVQSIRVRGRRTGVGLDYVQSTR